MIKIKLLLLIFMVGVSFEKDGDSDRVPNQNNLPDIPVCDGPEEEVPFSVTIGESDLSILPVDSGGRHIPVYKGGSNSPYDMGIYEWMLAYKKSDQNN